MNKYTLHRSGTFVKSTFAALLVAFTLGISSFTEKGDPIVKTAAVNHLGYSGNNSVFQLKLDNEAGEKFNVSIKDEFGFILYSENFKDTKFNKRFVINKEEGLTKLTFVVYSFKAKETQKFEINTTTRFVENYDVAIKKF